MPQSLPCRIVCAVGIPGLWYKQQNVYFHFFFIPPSSCLLILFVVISQLGSFWCTLQHAQYFGLSLHFKAADRSILLTLFFESSGLRYKFPYHNAMCLWHPSSLPYFSLGALALRRYIRPYLTKRSTLESLVSQRGSYNRSFFLKYGRMWLPRSPPLGVDSTFPWQHRESFQSHERLWTGEYSHKGIKKVLTFAQI